MLLTYYLNPGGQETGLRAEVYLEGRYPAGLGGRLESRGRGDESEEESEEAGPERKRGSGQGIRRAASNFMNNLGIFRRKINNH